MNLRKIFSKKFFFALLLFSFAVNYSFSQNLVKNSGFETGLLSPNWGFWPKQSNVASIDNVDVYYGNFSVTLNNDEVYFYQPVSLEPNTTYTVSGTVKSESGDIVWFGVSNVNSSGGTSRNFTNTDYETKTWSFTTDDSPGDDPKIYIWKDNGSGIAWADSLVLLKDNSINQPKPPGGFNTYYVSPLGDDSNSGTSPGEPWQTIDKVNSMDFGPTDEIFFEGGNTFYGTIVLNADDHGTTDSKVSISSYGTGNATINAQNGSGLIAYDCSELSISNLDFVGSGRLTGNTGNGVTFSYCSNIVIDNVEISGFQHSGLKINSLGQNYNIQNIYSHDNGYAGIYVLGIEKSSFSNIYIGHCFADNNPGDPTVLDNHSGNGIFVYNASNVTIEYCEASDNGWGMPWNRNGPGGIWVAEADNILIQHCISHDNKTSPGALDGLGFDLDGGTTNSTIQYCLSYNNQGAGFGIFQYDGATDWNNNTIRFCVSENDGNTSAPGSVYFWNGAASSSQFNGFEFYNNVVYNAGGPALAFFNHKNLDFNFRNNIFVSNQNSVYSRIDGENFQGNCWFSLTDPSSDSLSFIAWAQTNNQEKLNGQIVGMFADPMLNNPGNSTLTDPTQLGNTDDYKVTDGSVVINAGLDLNLYFNIDPGMQDYFGGLIKQGPAFDIGIHEYIDPNWQNQEIILVEGWNIMSVRVVPADSDFLNILQPLIDEGKLKKVMDESGKVIEDYGINNGGWQNNIGDLKNTEGYKINVTSESSLKLDGTAVKLAYNIPLTTGWNIISWPSSDEQNGMDVFQTLINEGKLQKVMDETGRVIEDYGDNNGGWQNFIGNFRPGEGYKVNVKTECILTIYENSIKSAEYVPELIASTHFVPAFKGNGTDHMNVNLFNLAESGIREGDEIGVFDGDICVGSAQIPSLNTTFYNRKALINIPVSAIDGNEGRNGYTDGNPILLKLYRNGTEYDLNIEPINNSSSLFKKGSSLFAKVDIITGIVGLSRAKTAEIKCYPNPFMNEITIELNLPVDAEVQIEVFNQLGMRVKTIGNRNQFKSGTHLFKWNGINVSNQGKSAGVYHLRIVVDDEIIYQKIMLSK